MRIIPGLIILLSGFCSTPLCGISWSCKAQNHPVHWDSRRFYSTHRWGGAFGDWGEEEEQKALGEKGDEVSVFGLVDTLNEELMPGGQLVGMTDGLLCSAIPPGTAIKSEKVTGTKYTRQGRNKRVVSATEEIKERFNRSGRGWGTINPHPPTPRRYTESLVAEGRKVKLFSPPS